MKTIDLVDEQNKFLKALEISGKSFNTVKNYRTDLNCFNKFMTTKGRDLFITEITLQEVKEYGSFLDKTYNSPNSIRRRVQALRIFFDFLLQKNLVQENMIKKAIVSPKVVDAPKPPTFKEVIDLYKFFKLQVTSENSLEKVTSYRNLVIFYLIYGAGLKVSDISILKESHLNLGKDDKYRVMISHEKRDPYTVVLPKEFNFIYEKYKKNLETIKNNENMDFTNLLFNGNPYKILSGGLSPRGIEILFKDASTKLGTKITAKSLRQACVFKWLCHNESDSSIKEWLGVQPQYSLKPFHDLLKSKPDIYSFTEIQEQDE